MAYGVLSWSYLLYLANFTLGDFFLLFTGLGTNKGSNYLMYPGMKAISSIKFFLFESFWCYVWFHLLFAFDQSIKTLLFLRHANIISILELLKCGISLWGLGRVTARYIIACPYVYALSLSLSNFLIIMLLQLHRYEDEEWGNVRAHGWVNMRE